ncbi:Fic family protein [Candidatus Saccharibacteria bacterium]|nr:Fic family protein [Candidatus Saccharibacteria bacterium]
MNRDLLGSLREEKETGLPGGIYHKLQIEMTYNSNHIEGSTLTKEQTRYIFETNTIDADKALSVDDVVETANHFRCIDMIIDHAEEELTEKFIKKLHETLKNGTMDSRKDWFMVGDYKKIPNEVGGRETTAPSKVHSEVKTLLEAWINRVKPPKFEDIIEFHYQFEKIHPFQDGNGRIGRLVAFKECLKAGVVPFIIDEELKLFYYRGLSEWETEKGYLLDTCRAGQDKVKAYLDYFKIRT